MTKKIKFLLFGAAAVFLFFFCLGRIPLWSSDEGRYGEIAREMWESKNFIVPHFNELPYLEKPVFAPALTALVYGLFGVSAWSTRLGPAMFALLGIILAYRFTRKLFCARIAARTAIVLLTMVGYVLVGRFAVIDMIMAFFMSMTLFCLLTAFICQDRRYYLLAYVGMGLAFLTKGLIGIVLPGLVFFVFLMGINRLSEVRRMYLGWGCLILAVIILPWCVAISIKKPDFFQYFIIEHHFSRFASGGFGRKRPLWFFVPILIGTAFPWTFFLPASILHALRQERDRRVKLLFMICWIAVIFVFFSIPKSKLPYYLLPISMPLAILTAHLFAWENVSQAVRSLTRWAWKILTVILVSGCLGAAAYVIWLNRDERVVLLRPLIAVALPVMLAGVVSSYLLYRRQRLKQAFQILAGMIYAILVLTVLAMLKLSPVLSTAGYAEILKPILRADDEVCVFASPDRFSDFPFYLKRKIIVVGSDRGTLVREALRMHPSVVEQSFLQEDVFIRLFNARERREFCLMKKDRLDLLIQQGLKDYLVLKSDGDRVLISNG